MTEDLATQVFALHNALATRNPHLLDAIRLKKNSTASTQLDSRTLNYWTECGLVDKSEANSEAGWHKFSFVDIVFVHIAKKLRGFGMGMEQIRQTRQSLYERVVIKQEHGDTVLEASFNVLEAAVLLAFTLKSHGNIYLVIDPTGIATFMTMLDMAQNQEQDALPDEYIHLNLNALLSKNPIITDLLAKVRTEPLEPLQQNGEKQVLGALRQAGTTEVVVKKNHKTGKIVHLDMTQEVSDTSNMPEFGNLNIQRRHGKTVRTTRTTSVTIEEQ